MKEKGLKSDAYSTTGGQVAGIAACAKADDVDGLVALIEAPLPLAG